jgi:hypothetical protein
MDEELHQAYINALREYVVKKSAPKKSSKGWGAKEWTEDERAVLKTKWLSLEETIVGTILVNSTASNYHIADIVFRQHWRHKIPDDIWDAFVLNVKSLRKELNDSP